MRWLLWVLISVAALGALGVTSGLALRTLRWQDLILWTGVGYVCVASLLLATGQTELRVVENTSWALVTALCAIGGLICLYLALGAGEASKVVPVSASYPAVTLVLAAIVLSENVSPLRWVGAAMVIAGVVVVTVAR
jgi:transporter family protein